MNLNLVEIVRTRDFQNDVHLFIYSTSYLRSALLNASVTLFERVTEKALQISRLSQRVTEKARQISFWVSACYGESPTGFVLVSACLCLDGDAKTKSLFLEKRACGRGLFLSVLFVGIAGNDKY